MVGIAREVSGRCASSSAERTRLRRRRQVPRAGKHPLCSLLPRRNSAVSVSPSVVPRGRVQWPTLPVFDLWKQESRRETEDNVGDGFEQTLARGVKGDDWRRKDGCNGDY